MWPLSRGMPPCQCLCRATVSIHHCQRLRKSDIHFLNRRIGHIACRTTLHDRGQRNCCFTLVTLFVDELELGILDGFWTGRVLGLRVSSHWWTGSRGMGIKKLACTISINNSQRYRLDKSYLIGIDFPYQNWSLGPCLDTIEFTYVACGEAVRNPGLNVLQGQRFVASVGEKSE